MRGECIKFISLSFSLVGFQKLYFELFIARFYAILDDMTMWIVCVVMPYDDELGIGDTHHLHVFNGYLSHELIRQTWFAQVAGGAKPPKNVALYGCSMPLRSL